MAGLHGAHGLPDERQFVVILAAAQGAQRGVEVDAPHGGDPVWQPAALVPVVWAARSSICRFSAPTNAPYGSALLRLGGSGLYDG
ncbi:MAG: hypothetical protein HND48_23585 [Chloroflexi bacterium]|nr:hypothetical protein [Chloroflexota bacterium]